MIQMVERKFGEQSEHENRVVVVTDAETADGFQLSGVEVEGFYRGDAAASRVTELLDDDSVKLVLTNEEYIRLLDPEVRSRIEEPSPPTVVALPHEGDPGSRMASLMHFINRSWIR